MKIIDKTHHLTLLTNHGPFQLSCDPNHTIKETLETAGVPLSAVSTYYVDPTDPEAQIHFLGADEKLRDFAHPRIAVFARLLRNFDPTLLRFARSCSTRHVEDPATEWLFPHADAGCFQPVLSQMSAEECLAYVRDCVERVFLSQEILPDKLIVGTSGGGDSNVLLSCLVNCGLFPLSSICPVMMLGIPDWDEQLSQAQEICAQHNLTLDVLHEPDVARYLGVRSMEELRTSFLQTFPGVDLEFLGTWALRRTLSRYALAHSSSHVVIGANREDLISEGFSRIAMGKPPLPSPFRSIGDVTFVYPMCDVPKKIGDGAFPRYSFPNYEHRRASFTDGRAVFYYLAHAISDALPGLDKTLLAGFTSLAQAISTNPIAKSEKLNDFICSDLASPEAVERWRNFLASLY